MKKFMYRLMCLAVMLIVAGCQPFTINATNTGCCGGAEAIAPLPKGEPMLSCHGGVNVIVYGSNNKSVKTDTLTDALRDAQVQAPTQGGTTQGDQVKQ